MSFNDTESKEFRASVALELVRHKALVNVAEGYNYVLDIEDVNECLVVAGLPLIVPGEINAKEVNIIKTEKEANHDTV